MKSLLYIIALLCVLSSCWVKTQEHSITLLGNTVNSSSPHVSQSGSWIYIHSGWIYEISGTLQDMFIQIDIEDTDEITLLLAGVKVENSYGNALRVLSANQVNIENLAETYNFFSDGKEYSDGEKDKKINAAVFSKTDLLISGEWTLEILWNYNDGITSKDTLKIQDTNLIVQAADDGVRWKDYLEIKDSQIKVVSEGDSLKSDDEQWTICIDGGKIYIDSWDDGVRAEKYVHIYDGDIDIVRSYEWIEAMQVHIHDGDVSIQSQDDGINLVWKDPNRDESYTRPVEEVVRPENYLSIYGGNIEILAQSDAIDANGYINMYGGTLHAFGNIPFDYYNGLFVSGGTLIGMGSMEEKKWVSQESSQAWVLIEFPELKPIGTNIVLQDESWKVLLDIISKNIIQWMIFSHPHIIPWEKYKLLLGGKTIDIYAK